VRLRCGFVHAHHDPTFFLYDGEGSLLPVYYSFLPPFCFMFINIDFNVYDLAGKKYFDLVFLKIKHIYP